MEIAGDHEFAGWAGRVLHCIECHRKSMRGDGGMVPRMNFAWITFTSPWVRSLAAA